MMKSPAIPQLWAVTMLLCGACFSNLAVSAPESTSINPGAPELRIFPSIKADETGRKLAESMIWTGDSSNPQGVALGIRKSFDLSNKPQHASISLFADARYILWVNGTYVDRGPSRFQPNGPQYDVVNVARYLDPGKNVIALLVVGNLSGGKVMRHVPGLTAILEADGREVARTDNSWKWTNNTRYRQVAASWPNLGEKLVDARVEAGDWTLAGFDDTAWKPAVKIAGNSWGPLTRTIIPPLGETPLKVEFAENAKLPVVLQAGQKLSCETGRIVQAYAMIEMDADAGTELLIEPYGVRYIARAGKQTHVTIDTKGITSAAVTVKSGRATITKFQLIERIYPYTRLGSFQSNDTFLNRLWDMCARSCEVLSEDAYVDCADRERVEWMDCTPPAFDITRTAMAGPGTDGKLVYSDSRLLGQMVRRTALTLQPEGWVKAHTCSDRFDIHAKMEDRGCEWVTGTRLYYESSGDLEIVREIWPAIVTQMEFFLKARTPRGLVRARDWVVWGNPMCYVTGETTTLNVFVKKALVDSAFLGDKIGDKANSTKFSQAAEDLAQAINKVLWDEKDGAFYSGYFTDADAKAGSGKEKLKLPVKDSLTPTTPHANVFALDRGVVPADRRARVIAKMLQQNSGKLGSNVMIYYYAMKELYGLDQPAHDQRVLTMMRDGWQAMVASPLHCSWESFGGGSKAHIYGMYAGYFLSSYVLGVRWQDGIPLNRKLLIQPHLGNLTTAEGTVVTEAGPVPVAWKRNAAGTIEFKLKVLQGVNAVLNLPVGTKKKLILNSNQATGRLVGNRLQIDLVAGNYTGTTE